MENLKALAYLRTSSSTNTGDDKDSGKRQRAAINALAKSRGLEIVAEYYDEAVSGADAIEDRPGFSELLDRIDDNGVRTIVVEDVSRFARDSKAHILGLALLRERGVTLLDSSGNNLTDDTDEMQEAMITVMAAFATVEKKRLVKKLKAARDRKKAETGKCGGRKQIVELYPGAVTLAKRLYRKSPKTGERRSLRKIAKLLADEGHAIRGSGKPFSASMVKTMCYGPWPESGLASHVDSA